MCPSLSGALEASQRPRLSGWSHPPAPCYPAHVSPSLPLLSLRPLSWGLCRVCTSLSVPGGPARLQAGSVRHTLLRAPAETPLPAQACVRHPAVWGSRLSAPAPPSSLLLSLRAFLRAFFSFLRASCLQLCQSSSLSPLLWPFCCRVSSLGKLSGFT